MPRLENPVRLDRVDPAICSQDYRLKIFGRLPFFRHLPDDAIPEINNLCRERDRTAHQTIYLEGGEAEHLLTEPKKRCPALLSTTDSTLHLFGLRLPG